MQWIPWVFFLFNCSYILVWALENASNLESPASIDKRRKEEKRGKPALFCQKPRKVEGPIWALFACPYPAAVGGCVLLQGQCQQSSGGPACCSRHFWQQLQPWSTGSTAGWSPHMGRETHPLSLTSWQHQWRRLQAWCPPAFYLLAEGDLAVCPPLPFPPAAEGSLGRYFLLPAAPAGLVASSPLPQGKKRPREGSSCTLPSSNRRPDCCFPLPEAPAEF